MGNIYCFGHKYVDFLCHLYDEYIELNFETNGLYVIKEHENRPLKSEVTRKMVGREKEKRELDKLYASNQAELVAIYGRRRIGKTYLVDEVLQDKITFRHAGLSPLEEDAKGLLRAQLDHFYNSLKLYGMEEEGRPDNWLDAFFMLEKLLHV